VSQQSGKEERAKNGLRGTKTSAVTIPSRNGEKQDINLLEGTSGGAISKQIKAKASPEPQPKKSSDGPGEGTRPRDDACAWRESEPRRNDTSGLCSKIEGKEQHSG